MRTLKQFMVLVVAISVASFTSCKSDDDGGNPGGGGGTVSGTITANINGNQFTSLEITSFANLSSNGGNSTLIIQGNSQSQAISIIINGYDGVGTYEISDDNVFIVASYIEPNASNPANTQTWSAPFENSGIIGEISISAQTETNVQGTFNFDAKNNNDDTMKNITDGSFNVTLQTT